jgi:hypothetical protein
MDKRSEVFAELAECILVAGAYKATKYLSEKETIKATQKRYGGKIVKNTGVDIVFTIGKPNYQEREFIKKLKLAGEPFPVKKIQLKFPPTKKDK